jgi:hypothetical protein
MKLHVARARTAHNNSLPIEAAMYAPMTGRVGSVGGDVPWGLIIAGGIAAGGIVGLLIFYGRN